NQMQVITSTGTEYMLQSDDQDVIDDWFESLTHATTLNNSMVNNFSNVKGSNVQQQDLGSHLDLSRSPLSPSMASLTTSTTNSTSTLEKSKFKEKLKLWLLKRPTKETLREKGIYKDGIFGSTLSTICEKEGSEIPLFVTHCIEAVEERGLYVDGIYRANGNMAEIQKLRFAVNTSDLLTSSSTPPPDIHVITGALKLFFRELQEPLFPYEHYNSIMNVINSKSRAQSIKNILASLPRVNYLTLTVLLQHLLVVVSHSSENRMHIQNLSIIFGPTLMWPKESDDQSLAVSMVMRSQLVDMLLQDYSFFFDSVI
ncbi:hypothetical protein HELRODRAFT_66283, partial [Helobdella robusta]|uniref:Rho-GAP domain-containing protein n=1 Tax=Helobdella robusta TaxID=6412 RepID=T1FYJ1_HELRO